MINARMARNGKDASDLIAALVSNVRSLQNRTSRLSGDLRRLGRKIDATHRAADHLHHKIQSTHARIRIDAIFQAVIIRPWEGHGPS